MINSIGVSSNIYSGYASNVNFQGKAKANTTTSAPATAETNNTKANNKRFLTSTILLLGGAALGYGHRKYLDKAGEFIGKKIATLAETPVCQKAIAKGSELLNKVKDVIFVKAK